MKVDGFYYHDIIKVGYWRFLNLVFSIPSGDIPNNIQITALKPFLGFRDYVSSNC